MAARLWLPLPGVAGTTAVPLLLGLTLALSVYLCAVIANPERFG